MLILPIRLVPVSQVRITDELLMRLWSTHSRFMSTSSAAPVSLEYSWFVRAFLSLLAFSNLIDSQVTIVRIIKLAKNLRPIAFVSEPFR